MKRNEEKFIELIHREKKYGEHRPSLYFDFIVVFVIVSASMAFIYGALIIFDLL